MSGTRRKAGPLAPYVDGYRLGLVERGYTPQSIRAVLKGIGQLGRWMSVNGVEPGELSAGCMQEFRAARRAGGYRQVPGVRSLASFLEHLRDERVIPAETSVPCTPVAGLLGRYRVWLVRDRGLAPATVLRYENLARDFLQERSSTTDTLDLEALTGADVTAFLLRESARLSIGSAKGRVAELRSLLRFLHLSGETPSALASAVPPVAGWRDTGVPPTLAASDVQALLDSCDRSQPIGLRDLAILMLLARLGLRSAEVARLELDDIDWRAGELTVRGKGRRCDRLPLLAEVGEAVAGYLSRGRPSSGHRSVFLTARAPRRPLKPAVVGDIVRRACVRTGLPVVRAHRLRHALATEMLRKGASLTEISQVLRHRDLATTAVYAKVDRQALRQIAQPWPVAR